MPETHPDLPRSVGKGQSALYADLRSQHLRRNGDSPDPSPNAFALRLYWFGIRNVSGCQSSGPAQEGKRAEKKGASSPTFGQGVFFRSIFKIANDFQLF